MTSVTRIKFTLTAGSSSMEVAGSSGITAGTDTSGLTKVEYSTEIVSAANLPQMTALAGTSGVVAGSRTMASLTGPTRIVPVAPSSGMTTVFGSTETAKGSDSSATTAKTNAFDTMRLSSPPETLTGLYSSGISSSNSLNTDNFR